jgi:polysaccharide pyruvyl transferase WcaK-like protein
MEFGKRKSPPLRAGMTRARAQNVIDGDIAFLVAHPTKKSKPMSTEAKERRRNFKEAMRRRIRDIAASRDLSDEEIKPVLKLKHEEVGRLRSAPTRPPAHVGR